MRAAITEAAARRRARVARLAGLYALTPDLADTAALIRAVTAALDGGATAIQYRNKTADAALRSVQATALARLRAARGALLIVNDDPQLAAAIGADGVHLGEDDAALAAARECVGPERLIGVSCYNDLSRARAVVDAGADYVAFGSIFASAVKPDARRADLAILSAARALGVPIVAIGGITADNAAAVHRAGADAVAVITAVFGAGDTAAITAAAHGIARAFPPAPSLRVEHA